MAANTITGARTTGGILQAIRKIDMSSTVMELEPALPGCEHVPRPR